MTDRFGAWLCIATFACLVAACGNGSSGTTPTTEPPVDGPTDPGDPPPTNPGPTDPGPTDPGPTDPGPSDPACTDTFDSTFDAIQTIIFERHGCTAEVCHGSGAAGGLDLSAGAAYDNLYNQPGQITDQPLVQPGRTSNSLLYLKLAAATLPDRFTAPGAPMPNGGAPLTEDELELVRLWIYSGAPENGVIESTVDLVDGCLPDPTPITIEPLDAPATDEGVQFVMPQFVLDAASETEVCFASYYDFTDIVPDEFKDPTGTKFRYRGFDMRQDPQSHHLILYAPDVPLDQINHPAYGEWTCRSGDREGESCDPTDLAACPGGLCASRTKIGSCFGFGPPEFQAGVDPTDVQGIGGAQRAQLYTEFGESVYAELPLRGLIYWNSHAFNLTPQDHRMNARLNYLFSDDPQHISVPFPISFASLYQAAGTPPFTEQRYCNSLTFDKGTHITEVTQHTHRFGRHFEAWLPDGTKFYDNRVYNDPVVVRFDPPLVFDSDDAAERTIEFCGLFNNGMAADGSPDPDTVTRHSRTPQNQLRGGGACEPVACAEGRVGEPCNGVGDDATCDTSPGAGDGFCDACAIQAGVSTENSMFLLLGRFYKIGE